MCYVKQQATFHTIVQSFQLHNKRSMEDQYNRISVSRQIMRQGIPCSHIDSKSEF